MNTSRFLLTAHLRTLLVIATRRSRAARSLTRTGQWTALAAVLLFTLGVARSATAQTNLIHVTTTAPGNSNGGCSLQEAIYSANFDQAISIDTVDPDHFYNTGCEAGSGTDTIVLPAGSVFQMTSIVNDAHNRYGPTATPIIFSAIIIEANGSRLELVPGSPNMRAFAVGSASVTTSGGTSSGTGNLTIRNAHIKGFSVKGGNGADGGGGGLGAGGAIYVDGSEGSGANNLTVENSTFEGNGATGGNGSANNVQLAGGGGGSLWGNGGRAGSGSSLMGGGGGGGSRGGGADGSAFKGNVDNCIFVVGCPGGGGGGGGTITGGQTGSPDGGGQGGFDCGGNGGTGGGTLVISASGADASCPGGGVGSGGSQADNAFGSPGNGGNGNYGGGGSGYTGSGGSDAGNAGFGAGGGSAQTFESNLDGSGPRGGNGGYGGGGGAGHGGYISGGPGHGGGQFAGSADQSHGGGGAALGGAIFSHFGNITIRNGTFTGNFVNHGLTGGGTADQGRDEGGAIFAVDGELAVLYTTISGNQSTGEGAGIVVDNDTPSLVTSFTLRNTIIANNSVRECFFQGPVTYAGSGNLIVNDFGCTGLAITPSPDPQLGPLQIDPLSKTGTPTMAIQPTSPAVDVADASFPIPTDQRGVSRPIGAGFDIGAFEAALPEADLSLAKTVSSSTAQIGDTVTYALTLTNLGPQMANNVLLTDNFPSALTFVSCTASGGGVCAQLGGGVTVTYATLAANQPQTITIQGTLNAGVQDNLTVTNSASVQASSPDDPNPSNNSASALFMAQNNSDLSVNQSATKLTNRQLKYTVSVKNLGKYLAKQILLTDALPNGSKFVSISLGAWNCSAPAVGSTGTISCTLNSLAVSATQTITFVVKVTTPGNVLVNNTGTVSAATFDPNTANNSSTLVTKLGP